MNNTMKLFMWLILLVHSKQTQTIDPFTFSLIAAKAAPVVLKVGALALSVAGIYALDKAINGDKEELKKRQQHEEDINYVRNLSAADLEAYLIRVSKSDSLDAIPVSWLFEQYDYYQFPEFQDVLKNHSQFEPSIWRIRDQIKNGKKIDFFGTEEKQKFDDALYDLVRTADIRFLEQEKYEKQQKIFAEQQKLKEKQQTAYRTRINEVFDAQKSIIEEWCVEYTFLESQDYVSKIDHQRYEAFKTYQEKGAIWQEKTYCLQPCTGQLLGEYAIDTAQYTYLYGNQVQQIMHTECISILDETALLRYGNITNQDAQSITNTLTLFADAGRQYNQAGHIKKAISFTDFCWNLLEMYQIFLKGTVDFCLEEFRRCCRYEAAIRRGAFKGVQNFGHNMYALGKICQDAVHACAHPVETAKILCPKIRACATFIAECYQKDDKTRTPLLFFWHPTEGEIASIKIRRKKTFDLTVKTAHQFLHELPTYFTEQSIENALEKTSEVVTETALSYATGRAMGAIAQAGSNALATSLEGLEFMHEVPATMGSMQACIVLEATELAEAAAAARAFGQECAVFSDVVGKIGAAGSAIKKSKKPTSGSNSGATNSSTTSAPTNSSGGQNPNASSAKNPTNAQGGKGSNISNPNTISAIGDTVELARIQSLFKVAIPGLEGPIHPKVAVLKVTKILEHILVDKHNFARILVDPKCEEGLRRLLSLVMEHGALRHHIGDTYIKSLCVAGEMVEIKGVLDLQGKLDIGTAWIT